MRPSWRRGTRVWLERDGCRFDPQSRKNYYFLIFPFFRSSIKAKSPPLSFATQYLEKFDGKCALIVLTIGSLCLPYCMQNITWSWFKISSCHSIKKLKHIFYIIKTFLARDISTFHGVCRQGCVVHLSKRSTFLEHPPRGWESVAL